MKTSKPKAHRMWANYYPGMSFSPAIHPSIRLAKAGNGGMTKPVPVAVIPLDDVEGMVEVVTKALTCGPSAEDMMFARADARKVLAAIGMLPRARKGLK